MAGYLIRPYPVENCRICCSLLKAEKPPESSPVCQFEFLRFKNYRESNNLFYTSTAFSHFVQHMEVLFHLLFGGIMYQKDLLKTFQKSTKKEVTDLNKCGNFVCLESLHQYLKLYMNVRTHQALKLSSIAMTYGHNRNTNA